MHVTFTVVCLCVWARARTRPGAPTHDSAAAADGEDDNAGSGASAAGSKDAAAAAAAAEEGDATPPLRRRRQQLSRLIDLEPKSNLLTLCRVSQRYPTKTLSEPIPHKDSRSEPIPHKDRRGRRRRRLCLACAAYKDLFCN